MSKITPMGDNVICKVVEVEAKIGIIIVQDSAVEKGHIGEVIVPNEFSYHRDGSTKPVTLKSGDMVQFQSKNMGTELSHAPDGEKWVAIPEDCIVCKIEG